jgi:replicative DNA helicase
MVALSCARRFRRQAAEGESPRLVVKFDLENDPLEAQPRFLAGLVSTRKKMEGSHERLTTRAIEDDFQNIQSMTDPQMRLASEGSAELEKLPVVLDGEGQGSPGYIRARLLAEKARAPLGLVIVDYMELVEGEGRTKTEEVMSAMRGLHFIARDLRVPVIVLSQTNRNQTSRMNGEPYLSDLSWGDALAKYSKMVVMPFNPFVHWQQTGEEGPEPPEDDFDLWVRKNKGPQGLHSLKIDRDVPMLYDPQDPVYGDGRQAAPAPRPSKSTPF